MSRTIVFNFGGRAPTKNAQLVHDNIYHGHNYYNKLIELERCYRKAIRAAQAEFPEIAKAQALFDNAEEAVDGLIALKKLAKSSDSSITPPTPDEMKKAVAEKKAAAAALKDAKAPHADSLQTKYKAAKDELTASIKKARSETETFWGTYLCIERAFQQAKKAKPIFKPGKKRPPWTERPAWRKWTGHGVVGMQIQNGMPAENLFKPNTRCYIDPLPANAYNTNIPRGQRRKMQYTTIHLRVGSENRKPIWADIPVYLHRGFPAGAIVKWVCVIRTPWHQHQAYKWQVQITLEVPDAFPKTNKKAVAINLGWRKLADGSLRAATWVDTDGQSGEIILSDKEFRDRIEKYNNLRSIRDKLIDEIRPKLIMSGINCAKWKSPDSFQKLSRREDLTDEQSAILKPWAYKDRHLNWYARGVKNGALNHRRDVYRKFALYIATNYDIIIAEKYDMKNIVEDEDRKRGPAGQRVEAAPSIARQIIGSTATRLGCHIIEGQTTYATQECFFCGCTEPWDASGNIMHTCQECGEHWDQDINNAKNMLARAADAINSLDPLAPKKSKNYGWKSVQEKKKQGDNEDHTD